MKLSSQIKKTQIRLGLSLVLFFALNANAPAENAPHEMESWVKFSYEPYPLPIFVDDVDRYPAATPPADTVNRHGEIEHLGGTIFGTHWFVEAAGVADPVWHFVTAGDPRKDVVLLVHGYPDTWYAFHDVMVELAEHYYVIAVDTLGYGQSDKRPEVDVSYAAVAASLVSLLDKLGVAEFNLISHDRGTVVSENMIALDGVSPRISAYLRMTQSFDQPHGLPRPPHAQMSSVEWQGQEGLIRQTFTSNYVSVQLPEEELARLEWEFGFPGTAEAAARTFQGTSFDIELAFRMENVVPKMTMPVLLLQGTHDPGQHPEEYYRSADVLPNARVALVDANHFIHAEDPSLVATLAHELFTSHNRNRPEKIFTHHVKFLHPVKE